MLLAAASSDDVPARPLGTAAALLITANDVIGDVADDVTDDAAVTLPLLNPAEWNVTAG